MPADIGHLKGLPAPMDAATFYAARCLTKERLGGADALYAKLEEDGFVEDGKLTTGTKPFNVFARVASGAMSQPGMEAENVALGAFGARFVVASNRPENDDHWESDDPEWVGKASMAKRHRFLTTKDLSWQYFNVLSFGLDGHPSSLRAAIEFLEAMQDAAIAFASDTPGWSADPERLGLFFHCYPHNSVNSLHMHMVDLGCTGPTFEHFAYKNLPLADVLAVLKSELRSALVQLRDSTAKLAESLHAAVKDVSDPTDADEQRAALSPQSEHSVFPLPQGLPPAKRIAEVPGAAEIVRAMQKVEEQIDVALEELERRKRVLAALNEQALVLAYHS